MTTWTSPNGVEHLIPENGQCATCGRRHAVTERTCSGCGATYASLTPPCPLCGLDPRHAIVVAALVAAGRAWMTETETATRVLDALNLAEVAAYETEDDDAVQ